MTSPIPPKLPPDIAFPAAAQNLPRQLKIIRAIRRSLKTTLAMKKASQSFTNAFKGDIWAEDLNHP
jgi:hypothetical protein